MKKNKLNLRLGFDEDDMDNTFSEGVITAVLNDEEIFTRVFDLSENVDWKNLLISSKAAERSAIKRDRIQYRRRRYRKIALLKILVANKMCPHISEEELKNWSNNKDYPKNDEFTNWLKVANKKNINPYTFRNLCVTKELNFEIEEDRYIFGRALYHICQRRGYLAQRGEVNEETTILEEYREEIEDSIILSSFSEEDFINKFKVFLEQFDKKDVYEKPLFNIFNRYKGYLKKSEKTFEENRAALLSFLNKKEYIGKVKGSILELSELIEKGGFVTLGSYFYSEFLKGNNVRGQFYTGRLEHYLVEFNQICQYQNIDKNLKKQLYKAIFYQRPIKVKVRQNCPLEPKKKVLKKSHPEAEFLTIYSFINSIEIKTNEDLSFRKLSTKEKEIILNSKLFFRTSKPYFFFSEIRKKFNGAYFNYNDDDIVFGSTTIAGLKSVFGNDFKNTIESSYTLNKDKEGKLKTIDAIIDDVWFVLDTFDNNQLLEQWAIDKLNISKKMAQKFARIKMNSASSKFSLKATKKINSLLYNGYTLKEAISLSYSKKINSKKFTVKDGFLCFPERNDALNISNSERFYLNNLKSLLNNLIKENKINQETEVSISISRNITSVARRMAIYLLNIEDKNLLNKIEIQFSNDKINFNQENIEKHKLWIEQKGTCLYSGVTINYKDLFTDKYSVVHIIPLNVSGDDDLSNKTLIDSSIKKSVSGIIPFETSIYPNLLERLDFISIIIKDLEKSIKNTFVQINRSKGLSRKNKIKINKEKKQLELRYWKRKLERFTMTEVPLHYKKWNNYDTRFRDRSFLDFLDSYFYSSKIISYKEILNVRKEKCLDKIRNYNDVALDCLAISFIDNVNNSIDVNSILKQNIVNKITKNKERIKGALHQEKLYGKILREGEYKYVIRKDVKSLSAKDVENIADPFIKKVVRENQSKNIEEVAYLSPIKQKIVKIKKVRVFSRLKTPLEIRPETYAVSGSNHSLNFYSLEGVSKSLKYQVTITTVFEASKNKKPEKTIQYKGNQIPLVFSLKKGDRLLLTSTDTNQKELFNLIGFHLDGRMMLRHHLNSTKTTLLKTTSKINSLDIIRISPSKFDGLVEGVDFLISPLNEIKFLSNGK